MVGSRLVRMPPNTQHKLILDKIQGVRSIQLARSPSGAPDPGVLTSHVLPAFAWLLLVPPAARTPPAAMAIGALTISVCLADSTTSL